MRLYVDAVEAIVGEVFSANTPLEEASFIAGIDYPRGKDKTYSNIPLLILDSRALIAVPISGIALRRRTFVLKDDVVSLGISGLRRHFSFVYLRMGHFYPRFESTSSLSDVARKLHLIIRPGFAPFGRKEKFLRIEHQISSHGPSRIVVLSALSEGASSYGGGTGRGPRAILDASNDVELTAGIGRGALQECRHGDALALRPQIEHK